MEYGGWRGVNGCIRINAAFLRQKSRAEFAAFSEFALSAQPSNNPKLFVKRDKQRIISSPSAI
ncbi:hypothetical protein DPV78_006110 [Talaromyces pinophilus]|nr:hypothetical protein DPV78_006110 [Talaromyces pinophilus]